ncbi:GntR family transcriptional regulator [Hydrogenophaga luteola]|uniref:GntR family transcriptional regulator n=1 Tax=Hydrogenophaga luteola TaxID=1591122 RepID=A0ABV7W014_9BURK
MNTVQDHQADAALASTPSGSSETAQVRALLQLRELILSGELAGGTRIAELAIVERLGMSRTPIRAALVRLEQEGLLEALPSGGYVVQSFSERDVADAIELRGTLEGLLARLAAERGAPLVVLAEARQCLDRIDALLTAPKLDDEAFSAYVALNSHFHTLLYELADSPTITRQLERAASLPFASPSGFVLLQAQSTRARDMLIVAQDQHRQVLDAIEQREGTRAESIMREHSRLARRNLAEVLAAHPSEPLAGNMPAIRMIRRRR